MVQVHSPWCVICKAVTFGIALISAVCHLSLCPTHGQSHSISNSEFCHPTINQLRKTFQVLKVKFPLGSFYHDGSAQWRHCQFPDIASMLLDNHICSKISQNALYHILIFDNWCLFPKIWRQLHLFHK